jgi:spermidine synthase
MARPVRDHLLLAAAGASSLFTQYVVVREIGSTLLSTELVLLAATVVTLAGPSFGYALAHRLSNRAVALWGVLSVALLLALPVGLRSLVGAMAELGTRGLTLSVTVLLGGIAISGFYAVFLPRRADAPTSLPALYAAELSGALVALALVAVSPSYRVTLAFSSAAAILVLHLGLGRWLLSLAAAAAAAGVAIAYPRLDDAAARLYYAGYHGRRDPQIVETWYSPYQRIDVVDDARGRRSLYLDGVFFFRSNDADDHNRSLAYLPGLLHPGRGAALVIGSGSFSSAAYLRFLGYDVTVVELDEAVARIGFARFGEVHGLVPGAVAVRIEDGRRFLADTTASFDVIAVDVPAPYTVRTALLHTPDFYRLAASRLRPGGVVSLSLCGSADDPVGRAIAAAAAQVFASVIAVESAPGLAHLYGGAPLPFSTADVAAALTQGPRQGARVYADAEVRAMIRGVAPLTEARLLPVLVLAREALEDALGVD